MPKEVVSNFSKSEERYLAIAANLARSSQVRRYKHGAIIVRGGRIISTGINKVRNHPQVLNNNKEDIIADAHIHAEVDAIKKVSGLKGAKIYIARVNRSGQTRLSRPCEFCYDVIVKSGISKIVYT
jgi:deoxycytidylate deaminase